jgi:hypothetical protein
VLVAPFVESRSDFFGVLRVVIARLVFSHFAISEAKAHPQMERFFFSTKGEGAIYPIG